MTSIPSQAEPLTAEERDLIRKRAAEERTALQAQRREERIREEAAAAARRQKREASRVLAKKKQAERNAAQAEIASDMVSDKRKRFEYLLNSTSGDLFRTFVEASASKPRKKSTLLDMSEMVLTEAASGSKSESDEDAELQRSITESTCFQVCT